MIQAFHIFRKDLRHLWLECGVYYLLLFVFGISAPLVWPGSGTADPLLQAGIGLLAFLIPVAFFVLIVRVVHEERLVGVEQFWITRPYRWWSLLTAKGIFVLVCVLLPYMLMQCWLVYHAGVSVGAAASGISRSMQIVSMYALVPYMLVAAITATLTEAFMVLAGMLVVWLCYLLTANRGNSMNMSPQSSWAILAVLFTILLVGVLIYQYARRRTSRSRIAFAVTAGLFILLLWGLSSAGFGAPVRALIRSEYPLSSETSLRLETLPGPVPYSDRGASMNVQKGAVEIKLPVRLEGLPEDHKLRGTNISFTVEGQGYRYTSPWQTANIGDDTLSFAMQRKVFEHASKHKVHLHLEFLAEKLRPGASQVITAGESFSVPGNGRCLFNAGTPVCRYAFHMLVPTRIKASLDNGACDSTTLSKPTYTTLPVIPDLSRIDPIVQQQVRFEKKVCPASPLNFSEYVPAGKFRLQMEIPSIDVAMYKAQ